MNELITPPHCSSSDSAIDHPMDVPTFRKRSFVDPVTVDGERWWLTMFRLDHSPHPTMIPPLQQLGWFSASLLYTGSHPVSVGTWMIYTWLRTIVATGIASSTPLFLAPAGIDHDRSWSVTHPQWPSHPLGHLPLQPGVPLLMDYSEKSQLQTRTTKFHPHLRFPMHCAAAHRTIQPCRPTKFNAVREHPQLSVLGHVHDHYSSVL